MTTGRRGGGGTLQRDNDRKTPLALPQKQDIDISIDYKNIERV
jgi:hypothetical protein